MNDLATKLLIWPCRRTKKYKQTGEDGVYQTAQVSQGDGRKKKSKTAEDATQLKLALETEEERRAKNGLDLIWIEI